MSVGHTASSHAHKSQQLLSTSVPPLVIFGGGERGDYRNCVTMLSISLDVVLQVAVFLVLTVLTLLVQMMACLSLDMISMLC